MVVNRKGWVKVKAEIKDSLNDLAKKNSKRQEWAIEAQIAGFIEISVEKQKYFIRYRTKAVVRVEEDFWIFKIFFRKKVINKASSFNFTQSKL